ncbi:T9SS type B sorting domain-containing protein [Flavobacterium sp. AG291]|uniref:T9SS type B sorting domain-containing protein n=1 Tax=Flavobacterium sp. AG291 TaxID=2184000 RepID=UPI001314397E|nr:T9SS type B sorting domain-containing protein [Flavobacterium sp. AG291]
MLAQTPVPPGFSARLAGGSIRVKGDVVFVGNNILNRSPNPNTAYDGNTDNNSFTMEYIDIDGDPSTRNSSSANLTLASCDRVVYAGLYWASTYPYERSTDNNNQWNPSDANRYNDFNQIKFKLPTGGYVDITGTILFDGRAPVLNQSFKDAPAICYYDVTSLVQGLGTPTGTYTVANMRSSKGQRNGSSSAGWVMVVIYENPTLPSKFISTFDGYAGVSSGSVDIPINGFVTLPSPNPVNARLGVAALEGDKGLTGDKLQFKGNLNTGYTDIGNNLNPTTNFFNSTITNNDAQVPGRNPYGQNTLGLDLDMLPINNPNNSIVKNNETGATLRLSSSGDGFGAFLATFAVDIIEPKIKLVKTVQNSAGSDISGQNVNLSSVLDYVITFDNEGNDDAQNFVIRDILPVNTSFVSISMPTVTAAGGTYTYNAATGTLTINIPNSLVKKDTQSVPHTIKIRVQVASSCNELTDACSSIIRNTAYATYRGVINTTLISDDPSSAGVTTCGAPIAGPANFLVDVSACVYSRTEVICNGSLVLTGADGYGTYTWYKENGAVDIPMGTTQTITVYDTGEYYYDATPIAPCIVPIRETVYVTDFLNSTMTNPVIPYADTTPICPNNGTVLPKIFLCGLNDSQFIPTGINTGIVRWQKLNSTCTTTVPTDCPHNTCPASAWDTIYTGPNFTVTDAGEYRIMFDPNGTGACPMPFYFNVYKNNYDPQIAVKDIVCNTNGEIKVLNAPANYEIRLINQTTNAVIVDYPNTNPVFPIATSGAYIIEIKQTGVPNGCIFRVTDITVTNKTLTVNTTPTPKTCATPGSINVQALGVNPQYTFNLTGPGGVSITQGPFASNNFNFTGLNPGTYNVTVTTQDGCTNTSAVTVTDSSQLVLNAVVSQHISCSQGNIQMNSSGGKTPYSYAIYSYNGVLQNPTPADYQTSVIFDVPIGMQGDYVFIMIDSNNCTVLSNLVTINLVPNVTFTTTVQNVLCNGQTNGSISYNVTNANGYNVSYDLQDSSGTVIATNASGTFTGLAPGDYTVVLHQTKGNKSCDFPTTFTITQPAAITWGAPTLTQQYTCTTTGTITIDPSGISGGTAPYTYSINGTTYGTGTTFTGLTAGTYSVKIKDASGCVATTSTITIPALTPPTDLAFSATPITCAAPTATVTLTTTGGSGALSYEITAPSAVNNGTSNVFAGLAPGTYTFKVTDAKGCSYQENYTINSITPISVVGYMMKPVACIGTSTGAIRFNLSGYGANYNYSIASSAGATVISPASATGVTQNPIFFNNLAEGTYTITVTDPVTGCTATNAVTVTAPATAMTVTKTVIQPTCTTTTGSLSVSASGGWGSYLFRLTGAATVGPQYSSNFTGLAGGNYTLTVTDANGCIFTDNFTITVPVPPVLAVTASDICLPGTSLTVEVNTGTGLAPFQFSLNGGPYANGTAANGTTYTNLAAGTYTITVRDANGCTNTTAVTRTISPQLTASASVTKGLTCTAPADAQIAVTIGGGLAPYQYQISYNGGAYSALTATGGTSFTYNAATVGTYQFQITDAAGCTVTTPVRTIAPLVQPEFAFGTTTNVLCNGSNTGALTVNIDNTKGLAPYTIAVTNTTTSTSYGTQTSGLPAGNYSVVVTDANGCTVTHTATITQPNPITFSYDKTDISCNNPGGIAYGQIVVGFGAGITGGVGPYSYTVSNNFGDVLPVQTNMSGSPYTFMIVNYGIYTIEVTDANGCTSTIDDIVIASPPNALDINVNGTADCTNGGTATVEVGAVIIGSSYKFAILTQSNLPFVSNVATDYKDADSGTPTIATFTNLIPGVVYTFVVWDTTTDCYYFEQADIPIPTNSTITTTSVIPNNVTCTGAADGNVAFTFSGYSSTTTQVKYEIFRSPSNLTTGITDTISTTGTSTTVNNIPGNLAPGDYIIVYTEIDGSVAGCSQASASFEINQSPFMLAISAVVTKNDNCNVNAGIIAATAQFGTAPYTYQLLPDTSIAPTEATWAGQTSSVFNAEGGDYIVYVKDANDCIKPFSITLPTDVSPAITAIITPGTQCTAAEGSFSIDVTRTAGDAGGYTYSLDGGLFEAQTAPFTYTDLTSGTHTVQIMDANGCTMTTATSVTIYPPVDVTAQPTAQPTCLDTDGSITAAGTGGSGNYEYELLGTVAVAAQASPIFNNLPHGAYTVRIHDTTTGCTQDVAITLEEAIQILPATVTIDRENVKCNGGADGSITITLDTTVNTDIPYTYTVDGTLSAAITQSTPLFTNLAADTYDVTITSGKNCTYTTQVTITEPIALGVTATATAFDCAADNSVNTSTIAITATDGTPAYMYSIDGTSYFTTDTFDVVNDGTTQNITVYVKDANSCVATFPLTINPLPEITDFVALQQTAITCTNDETVTLTVTGGSGNYSFELLPAGSQPVQTPGAGVFTANFDLTAVGSYTFKVTDLGTSCTEITDPYTIAPFDLIAAIATASTPVTCFGSNDGTIIIDVQNYSGAYDYEVFDGTTSVTTGTADSSITNPFVVPNVTAGNLFVRVTATATPFCSADTNTIVVDSPADPLLANAVMTANVTCTNDKGEIIAQPTGGWGDYEFELVNNTTTTTIQPYGANNTFTGLAAGDYTVFVRDSGGCIVSQDITLTVPPSITASISASTTGLLCNGDTTASVTATGVTGGQGTYQYVLNIYDAAGTTIVTSTGEQVSPTFDNLGAGIYSITVLDGWGCDLPETVQITITEPTPLVGTLSLTKSLTCTTLAEVTISATGGTAPYYYSTDGGTNYLPFTAGTVFQVAAGTYEYLVKDNNNCTAVLTNQVEIFVIEPLTVNLTVNGVSCYGGTNALISAVATGGLGNYQYSLLDADNAYAVLAGPSANGDFIGLSSGNYAVRVTSVDCNTTSANVLIEDPDELIATPVINNILCFGDATGSITINTSGGTGNVQFAIAPLLNQFFDDNVFDSLPAGQYDILVQDENGCFIFFEDLEITEPTEITASIVNVTDVTCEGESDGTISVTVTGGTGLYSISTDNVNFTPFDLAYPNTYLLEGLPVGTTTVYVKDQNGCSLDPPMDQPILPGVSLTPEATVVTTCVANAPSNTVTVATTLSANALGTLDYSLDNLTWQSSNEFTIVDAVGGTYTVYVRHTMPVTLLQCTQTDTFTIDGHTPIDAIATITQTIDCFGDMGEITIDVTAGAGTAPFEYAMGPAFTYGSSNVFSNLAAGTYDFKVTDDLGCEFDITGVLLSQPSAAVTVVTAYTDDICLGDNDGTIIVTPSGGTPDYKVSIDGGTTFTGPAAGPFTFTDLAPNTYQIVVTDANNCAPATAPADIVIAPGLDIEPVADIQPTCINNVIGNYVFIVDDNGNSNLQYSLDGGAYDSVGLYMDVPAGAHTATILGDNGCIQTRNFTVPTLSPISASVSATTDIACFGDATGAITVTATGGTGTLSYAIADADVLPLAFGADQASGLFTGLIAGNYVVKIVDDNVGCETQVTATLAEPTAPLVATAGTQTDVLCYGDATGDATVNVTGGTGAYNYSWDTTPVQTTATATGLTAGTYTVTVTDANGCTTTQSFTITEPTAPLSAATGATQTDVLCYGDATGEATVNVTGGTGAYSYSWDTTPVQTTAMATGLTAGTYTVTVTDANGCTATQSFTITEPAAALVATAGTQTDVLCYGEATGEATVNVTGGTGAYSYSWDTTPVQTTATATGLTAGTYTVTVTDANGCTTTQSFTITEPTAPLSAATGATQTDVLCYGDATGVATVNVTGGTGAYSYSWDTTPVQTTATATGLTAGTYTVTVTDANGCTTTQSFTITEPAAPLSTATGNTQTDVLCYGDATGDATVNVTGGTGAYTYSWNTTPVQTTATATGLTAGTYTVTVTDANGCTATQSFTITEPAAPLSAATGATQTDVLCYGDATGEATVNVTGGTPTYSYSWDTTPVQTTATATGLTAGTYTVTVTDANGCTTTQSFTITEPAAALVATAGTQTDILCYGDATGDATVNVTGGTGAYTYSWDTTPVQTTATATGLTAGTYTVTVTDANGCTATQSFTITQPAAPLSAATGATQTDILCFGDATGSATVNVTGGTGAYTYSWNTTPVQTTATATGLTAGTYTVTVTDANGCTATQSFTITQPAAALAVTAGTQTDVLCYGNATGSAIVNVTGGTPTYSYSWNTTPVQTTATATGLTAGTYTVTVTDANGCTATQSFTITEPAAALAVTAGGQTDILCYGNATGSATVNVTGGTGAYSYSWNTTPVQTTATATGLTAGTYTVTVTDANGCTATQSYTIAQPAAALVATAGVQTNVLCYGNATGSATVNVTGGTGGYTYSWNTTPVQTSAMATGLTAGTYTVTVTDVNGCTTTQSFTITQPAAPLSAATGATQTNVLCFGAATGSATVNVTGGTPTYSYSWDTTPVQTTATATGLTAGTYTVTVTDANGCTTTQSFTITQPATAIAATAGGQTDVLCYGAATGTATVVATGGTGAYTYSWNTTPVQTTATATGLTAGTYTVTVTDANGCTAMQSYTITQPATALTATTTHTDEQCLGDNNGSVTVTPQGGVGPYTASLNGGPATPAPAGTPIVFNGLGGGTYNIVVTDANGCTVTSTATVLTGIVINPTVSTTQECDMVTVVVSVDPSVVGQVTYSLDGGTPQASNTFVQQLDPAVPHTVTVVHTQGCSRTTAPFTIAPVIPINLTPADVTVTNIACHGQDVGSAVVNATGGTGPLQYAITWDIWPTAFYGPSNTFTDLLAGDYEIHVKDAMGCHTSVWITITEPAQQLVIAAAVGQHESCVNAHDGAIDITSITGGVPPYYVALDSPANFQSYNAGATPDFAGLYGRALPYDVYVRDANGCYAKVQVTIEKGVNLVPNIQTVLSCVNNAPVNTVTATLNAIINDVEYRLETSTGTLIQDFDPNHTWELAPGSYVYTVRHINGCQKDFAFTVQPRVPITVTSVTPVDATCNGNADGTLTVVATGGTGALSYGISPDYVMTSNPVFTGLPAGTYIVRVQDQYGCYVDFTNFPAIGEPAVITVTDVMNLPETCVDDNDAAFEIAIAGGNAPYATSLDVNGPFVSGQTLFDNLDGGTYTVYIQDANGCTATHDVVLVSPNDIDAKAEVVYNCDQNTVTIVTNSAINPAELNYNIVGPKDGNSPTQTSNVFTNLEDGNYEVEVVNTVTGCTDIVSFNITSVPDLALSVAESGLNEVKATVVGGEGPYQYTFDGNSMGTKNTFVYYASGTYEITVTDARGCTRVVNITVEFIDVILPDVVSPNGDGQNDTWSPGNTENYPDIKSEIFDRYGRKLVTLRQGQEWDGTYDGHPMPTGDYWYLVKLGDADDRSFVGHFTIYR